MGDCDGYGFGLVGLVLVSSYGNSIGQGIAREIRSSIGISEAQSIGGSFRSRHIEGLLGISIGRSCLIKAWSRWPRLRGSIGGL